MEISPTPSPSPPPPPELPPMARPPSLQPDPPVDSMAGGRQGGQGRIDEQGRIDDITDAARDFALQLPWTLLVCRTVWMFWHQKVHKNLQNISMYEYMWNVLLIIYSIWMYPYNIGSFRSDQIEAWSGSSHWCSVWVCIGNSANR